MIELNQIQARILKLLPCTRDDLVKKLDIHRTSLFHELSKIGDWEYTNYHHEIVKGIGLITKENEEQDEIKRGRKKVIFKIKESGPPYEIKIDNVFAINQIKD